MNMNYQKKSKKLLGFLALFLFLTTISIIILPTLSFAAGGGDINAALNGLNTTANEARISTTRTVTQITGSIINLVMGFLGVVFLVLVIYGGFSWMTAGGNETKVKHGRDLVLWATIGLVVILFAFLVVNLIIFNLIDIAQPAPAS
jgi:hypothetical protein